MDGIQDSSGAGDRMTPQLADRHALVTGSSRGIGRVIALHLAQHGARVTVHGRDAGALADVRQEIEDAGGTCQAVAADLTDRDGVADLVRGAEEGLGGIDVLVANAGGSPTRPVPVEEMRDEDFVAAVELNLVATYRLVVAVLPGMKERGRGSIVTMSSAAARRPTAYSPIAYAAAKAGVELFTKDVALQAGPHGIRANCVAPETIITERTAEQIPKETQEQLIAQHPIRRLGTPLDVAEAVLYLASDRSAWVTGVVLDVAGGSVITQ
jgi:3-oxoacyl-[acyl-carrier protein] reductase